MLQQLSDLFATLAPHLSAATSAHTPVISTQHHRQQNRFRLLGWLRGLHISLVLAAGAAAAIPLFQLNARLAEQSLPDAGGPIAPHEWLGEQCCVMMRGVNACVNACVLVERGM